MSAMSAFMHKLNSIMTMTGIGFGLSLSKDVGILDVLCDAEQPLTSQQIADNKVLKERYVREILNSLATAELIHVSANETGSLVYYLDEDQKQVFQSSMLALMSFPSIMATLYEQVKSCFYSNGPNGMRYSSGAHDVIEGFSMINMENKIKDLLQSVDGLRERLDNGIQVIEFGCGKGRLLSMFAQMFPKSTFTASEVSLLLLEQLKTKLGHIPKIKFQMDDLCSLPDPPARKFDWVYCINVIHDLPNPQEALNKIHKLVNKPDGIFTMIDLATSGNPIEDKGKLQVACMYTASTFFCIPESFQREDSQALGPCWGKQTAINLATTAGFSVQAIDLENYLALYICRP